MKIDAHQHYWKLSRGDYGWLKPEMGPIYRDFMPEDLEPHLARHGVARTILVQAAPTEAETQFLLQIAVTTPSVAGVIGWVDFEAPDANKRLAASAKHDKFLGVRPMLQDIEDPEWLLKNFTTDCRAVMVVEGLVFDALVHPRHLPVLIAFMARPLCPTVVIDHCAKPWRRAIGTDRRLWETEMAALAARGAWCKLSGFVADIGEDWNVATIESTVRFVLETFGPDKIVWGSDWPVVNLAGGYDKWHDAARDLAGAYPQIFGANARECYLTRRGRNW